MDRQKKDPAYRSFSLEGDETYKRALRILAAEENVPVGRLARRSLDNTYGARISAIIARLKAQDKPTAE